MTPAISILQFPIRPAKKIHQGGIARKGEELQDKRMYATAGPNCPVKAVEFFISKWKNPSATRSVVYATIVKP